MKISPFLFTSFGGGRQKFRLQFCGLQIILRLKNLLTAATSNFRLPIGGGLQNTLPPKKNPGGDRQLGGALKTLWEVAANGFCLPKKLAFRQNYTLPPGGIINSVVKYHLVSITHKINILASVKSSMSYFVL